MKPGAAAEARAATRWLRLGAARDRGLGRADAGQRSTPLARGRGAGRRRRGFTAAGAAPPRSTRTRGRLHRCAAAPGGAQCARLLLEGAPIAMRDRAGQSAVHFARGWRRGDDEGPRAAGAPGCRLARPLGPDAADVDGARADRRGGRATCPAALLERRVAGAGRARPGQNRRTTLPPGGPLALATRRLPPDRGFLGGRFRGAAARV